jgi:PAS domain-containing protein
MPAGSSMSLFRLEDDGATTVLTRHPLVESEQGRSLRGHLAEAVARHPSGVFQATAQIDGIHRIVGYQQLPGDAHRLMIVYALGTQGVLSQWATLLPWAALLTLLVAATMAWGAWRLDRSVLALRRSERHFQTLASHLPDVVARYDREGRFLYVNPAVESANGLKPEDMIGRTIRETGTPESITAIWMACLDRVFSTGQGETVYFFVSGTSRAAPLGSPGSTGTRPHRASRRRCWCSTATSRNGMRRNSSGGRLSNCSRPCSSSLRKPCRSAIGTPAGSCWSTTPSANCSAAHAKP